SNADLRYHGLNDNLIASLRHRSPVLLEPVVDPHPVDLLRDPDVLGRRKGIAVVEGGEGHADHGAVGPARKQAAAAAFAKHPLQRCRGRIMRGVAFDAERALVERRAAEDRPRCRTLRRSKTRSLPTTARRPSRPAPRPARSGLLESSTA